jgi:cysteinyl-tRNA synthetase
MNFTFEALEAAQNALNRLRKEIAGHDEPKIGCAEFEAQFLEAVNDDLNMPKALSILWEVVRSDYPSSAKAETLFKFDKVLGLSLNNSKSIVHKKEEVPEEVKKMLEERQTLRKEKKFAEADTIREKILEMGYKVEDKY